MSPDNTNLRVCIMAGGLGERFWPFSRASRPKQLLSIVGDRSLIEEATSRSAEFVPFERIFVITTKDQASSIATVLPQLPAENILAEPYGRNTAPCIGLVCALLAAREPETVLAVIPADHWIPDTDIYARTMRDAAAIACREQALVTIGIQPRAPETGYGYILAGDTLDFDGETTFSRVERFVEKPPLERAQELIATSRAFWNAGMFVFRVSDMLDAFCRFMPEFHEGLEQIRAAAASPRLDDVIESVYADAPGISIDYAIMERADNVIVAHGVFNWDDVGSWTSVADHWPDDPAGNATRGDIVTIDSSNCVIGSDTKGVVGLVGVKDLIVVRTGDAVLVCRKDRAQDVKKLVERLRADSHLRTFVE